MMTRLSAALVALSMLLAVPAAAATLSMRDSTVLYEGTIQYGIDLTDGSALAFGFTSDGNFDLFVSAFFDAGTPGDNLRDVDLTLTDLTTLTTTNESVNARGLLDTELGSDFVWALFDDLEGALAGQFTGGQLLAFFSDPGLDGTASFELRRLDDLEVIPLPATGLLLLGGLAAFGLVRRKRG